MKKHGLKQAKYCYIKRVNNRFIQIDKEFNERELNTRNIIFELGFPMFVKPSNAGSSVGVRKVNNKEELYAAIQHASKYDDKIIVEEAINGREIECAVIGNDEVEASGTGEILAADEFYSYDAKYKNTQSKTIIPSGIKEEQEIRRQAIKAFKAIDGKGLSRVDFFVTKEGNIYINEINTMPGFTNISMYAKLWKEAGVEFKELIDKLIELAV